MMSIDEQEMRALAFLAARCRPTGAKAWDEAGIVANLRKLAHLNAAEVIVATIRAASNRAAESPGVIPITTGEHWREKVSESKAWRPPKKSEECPKHPGEWPNACGPCATESVAAYYDPKETTMPSSAGPDAVRAALRSGPTVEHPPADPTPGVQACRAGMRGSDV